MSDQDTNTTILRMFHSILQKHTENMSPTDAAQAKIHLSSCLLIYLVVDELNDPLTFADKYLIPGIRQGIEYGIQAEKLLEAGGLPN
jgi:hypothetical protein